MARRKAAAAVEAATENAQATETKETKAAEAKAPEAKADKAAEAKAPEAKAEQPAAKGGADKQADGGDSKPKASDRYDYLNNIPKGMIQEFHPKDKEHPQGNPDKTQYRVGVSVPDGKGGEQIDHVYVNSQKQFIDRGESVNIRFNKDKPINVEVPKAEGKGNDVVKMDVKELNAQHQEAYQAYKAAHPQADKGADKAAEQPAAKAEDKQAGKGDDAIKAAAAKGAEMAEKQAQQAQVQAQAEA